MTFDDEVRLSRRSMVARGMLAMTGAAVGAATGSSSTLLAEPQPAHTGNITTNEYWVKDGETQLYVYRKRIVAPGGASSPVLFLAHGYSFSSVPTYDLKVPGHPGQWSMMDVFARHGFDVWTMDFEGYGKSSRTGGNSDLERSVKNIKSVVPLIQKESGQKKFNYYGESSGALRIGMYAQIAPEQVNRMGFCSLSYTGEGSPTLAKRKESLLFLSTHDRRPRDREMIVTIFTRDKLGTYDPAVPDALAEMELKLSGSDSVPTGSYVDMTTKLPVLDPQKLVTPLLILRGEDDGIATEDDVINYFRKVATPDREYRLIPGATHAVGWGNKREVAWEALRSFLQSA